MQFDLFEATIKTICKMASSDLIRAAVEIGSLDNFYDSIQLQTLESAIDAISQELSKEIFDESKELDKVDWINKSSDPELQWLFSFESIR